MLDIKANSMKVLTIWGLIGVHTDKFGFKHVWEIWCGHYLLKGNRMKLSSFQAVSSLLWFDGLPLVCLQPNDD